MLGGSAQLKKQEDLSIQVSVNLNGQTGRCAIIIRQICKQNMLCNVKCLFIVLQHRVL